MKRKSLLVVFLLSFLTIPSRAGDFGINFYGLSYHFSRTTSDGRSFNEFNPGLGVKYVFLQANRSMFFCEGGIFSDSEKNTARYAAIGYGFNFIDSLLSLGLTVGPYRSRTLNNNQTLLAVIPTFSTHLRWLSVHLAYLPAYKDVNRVHAVGLFFSLYPLEF